MHQELLKSFKTNLFRLYQLSVDQVIAPPFCAYCKQFLSTRSVFCMSCHDTISPIVSVQLQITKTQSMTVLAIADYQEPLKTLLLAKSWSDITACSQLGQLIWKMTYFKHMPCDYLIPVPLHWIRHAKRGYNQAHEIAKGLAIERIVPVANILKRTKNTPFQSSLAAELRASNVKEAFELKSSTNVSLYENKHLVLVDDLMTTGSTLIASAKQLLALKPASISAVVVSRKV